MSLSIIIMFGFKYKFKGVKNSEFEMKVKKKYIFSY